MDFEQNDELMNVTEPTDQPAAPDPSPAASGSGEPSGTQDPAPQAPPPAGPSEPAPKILPPEEDPKRALKRVKRKNFRSGFIAGMITMMILSALVVCGATVVTRGIFPVFSFGNFSLPSPKTEESEPADSTSEEQQKTSDILLGGEEAFAGELQEKLTEIDQLIDEQFIFNVSRDSMMEKTLKGYVNGLDDVYSVYYTQKEFEDTLSDSDGSYVGIGVAVSQDPKTKTVTALTVYPGSPAEEGGMQKGDILVKVDGEDITKEDLSSVVARIRGQEDTPVTVTVYRDGEYIDLNMVRRALEKITVEYEMKEDGIGYIRLTEFDAVSVAQMKEAVETLHSQGMQRLVLDLRDNPGGLLTSVLSIADMFLPEANIFYSEDKQGNRTNYDAKADQVSTDPMVVLINGNSASASEVLSGSLKDNQRAVLVGEQSFGKGVVQTFFKLKDGGVKLTTAHYFTPDGTDIHGVGIEPNTIIADDLSTEADEQLDAAVEEVKKLN